MQIPIGLWFGCRRAADGDYYTQVCGRCQPPKSTFGPKRQKRPLQGEAARKNAPPAASRKTYFARRGAYNQKKRDKGGSRICPKLARARPSSPAVWRGIW